MAGEPDKKPKGWANIGLPGSGSVESNLTPSKTIDIDINKIVTITKAKVKNR